MITILLAWYCKFKEESGYLWRRFRQWAINKVFSLDVELVKRIIRHLLTPCWKQSQVAYLTQIINEFKRNEIENFEKYRASNKMTSYWHGAGQVVAYVKHVSGVEYVHGGF